MAHQDDKPTQQNNSKTTQDDFGFGDRLIPIEEENKKTNTPCSARKKIAKKEEEESELNLDFAEPLELEPKEPEKEDPPQENVSSPPSAPASSLKKKTAKPARPSQKKPARAKSTSSTPPALASSPAASKLSPVVKKALLIGGGLVLCLILYSLFGPASVSELESEILHSRKYERNKEIIQSAVSMKEKGIPILLAALANPIEKTQEEGALYLKRLGEPGGKALKTVLEDPYQEFDNYAKLLALEALGKLALKDSENLVYEAAIDSSKSEKFRQTAREALIYIDPKYKERFVYLDGRWQDRYDLQELGYEQTSEGWIGVGQILDPAYTLLEKAKKEKQNFSFLTNVSDKIKRDELIAQVKTVWQAYHKVIEELNQTREQYSGNEALQEQSRKVYQELVQEVSIFCEQLDQLGVLLVKRKRASFAMELYDLALKELQKTDNWELAKVLLVKDSFRKEKESLERRIENLLSDSQVVVLLEVNVTPLSEQEELESKLQNEIKRILRSQTKFPRFVASRQAIPSNEAQWLEFTYKEVPLRSHRVRQGEILGNTQTVEEIRSIAIVHYWKRNEGKPKQMWEDVISSAYHYPKMASQPVETLQQRLRKRALESFWQRFYQWSPDFEREPTGKENNERVKGNTLARQKAVDVITMTDGRVLRGLITAESQSFLELVTFIRTSRVGSTLYAKQKLKKSEVAKIKRIDPEIRAFRLKSLQSENQQAKEQKAIFQVQLNRVPWELSPHQLPAWEYTSKLFTLQSNTPQNFSKEIAYRTERIFEAYQDYFNTERNLDKKVQIYVFDSMHEYQKAIGQAFSNPAFFMPSRNLIMAGCDLTRYKKEVQSAKKYHDDLKKKIRQAEERLKRYKQQINEQKRKITQDLDRAVARGEITRYQYDAAYADIRRQMNEINKQRIQVKKYYRKLKDKILEINYRNHKLIERYISEMISTLYHEAFHAFLQNFLFEKQEAEFVPLWLNEGMAQFFENSYFQDKELIIGAMNEKRVRLLKKYIDEAKIVPMKKFLTAGSSEFLVQDKDDLENSTVHYLQSWAIVYYLSTQYDLKQGNFFSDYVRDIWKGVPPQEAFRKLVGMPLEEFDQQWQQALKKY